MSALPSIRREPRRPGPLCYQWRIVLGRRLWLVTVQPFTSRPRPRHARRKHRRMSRRMAYADPPYPGQALRHYGKPGDPYEGTVAEVDHAELIADLERDYPDGWALSTSVPALAEILALCPQSEPSKKRTWNGRGGVKLGTGVRVCVWKRTGVPFPPSRIMWAWEPLIVRTPNWRQRHPRDFVPDILYATQPMGFLGNEITGQKPVAFCHWLFDLLGLTEDDELVDLFPGSGAVGRAWEAWRAQTRLAV